MASVRVLNHILQRRHLIVSSTYSLNNIYNIRYNVWYSTKKSMTKIDHSETDNKLQTGFAEVVKENTKSAGYLAVIIGGIGVTALMFYAIFRELFSSKSPNAVYSKALKRCIEHPKVVDLLGAPIKAYGEETRRGRRNHVSHMYFIKNGISYMRMRFYIQGIRRRGTVTVEVKENASGKYEYSYLYVTVDHIGTVVIEDNQSSDVTQDQSILDLKLI